MRMPPFPPGFHGEEGPKNSDRTFGFVMAAFFLLLAFYPLVRHGHPAVWAFTAPAALFLVFAIVAPRFLRPLHLAWLGIGNILARIVNPVVMGVLFFGLFTPMGILMRWTKPDPLRRKMEREAKTYWIPRAPEARPGDSMPHQF